MKSNLKLPVFFVNLVLLAGLAAIWIMFAPSRIGGQVGYIIVNGISMEPIFRSGDLVLVRKSPAYEIGDVITYRDAQMSAYVIHRIIDIMPNGYVLQGDNNSWIDGYRPTDEEIIGKLWIHIPDIGRAFRWLHAPLNMAIALGLLGGVFMATMFSQPESRKNAKNKHNGTPGSSIFEIGLYCAAVLALGFLGLTIFAFSQPLSRQADDIKYQHNGVFYYSAQGAPNVYDADTVRAGEPLFPRLNCLAHIGFSYSLTSQHPNDLYGSHSLAARISNEQSGWQRTILLIPQTSFDGDSYSTTSEVNLCEVQALVADVEEQTGFRPSAYTLTIVPRVAVMGKVGGQEVYDAFETALVFRFDKVHFSLVSASSSATSPLVKSAPGSIINPASQTNTFTVFGYKFGVAESRGFGLVGLLISMGGLGLIGAYLVNLAKRDQDAFIRVKHGRLIMNVYDRAIESIGPVIDVASIEDLAKLAERQNAMILHTVRRFRHYYFVQADGTTYRYTANGMRQNPELTEESLIAHPEANGGHE